MYTVFPLRLVLSRVRLRILSRHSLPASELNLRRIWLHASAMLTVLHVLNIVLVLMYMYWALLMSNHQPLHAGAFIHIPWWIWIALCILPKDIQSCLVRSILYILIWSVFIEENVNVHRNKLSCRLALWVKFHSIQCVLFLWTLYYDPFNEWWPFKQMFNVMFAVCEICRNGTHACIAEWWCVRPVSSFTTLSGGDQGLIDQ